MFRSQELLVGCTDLRFTITWCREGRVGWGQVPQGCHDHRRSNSPIRNPSLGLLKGPRKFANIFGQLPGRIGSLPSNDIALRKHKHQHQDLWNRGNLTYIVVLPNRMPTHCSDQISRYRARTSREMPLQGQEIVGDWVVNTSRHTMRCKLEEWKGITVGRPRH